ncbi:MAG: Rrf2 family transcriptional regulator [Gemmatales bacterium]|nr:Rrf2 family transcriptional regulator [Gemmatales bacterium]MDW8386845.1 Rrf2 family transcriptional regulator [Gemmatales bacterium]
MRLTRASSYALHALVHIATAKPSQPTPSHEIAKAHQIPERFLLKVLKPLVGAGLLHSVKGPRGGYRLARPAREISLLEVIEAVEGPIRGTNAFHSEGPINTIGRKLDVLCSQLAEQTRKQLSSIRISSLTGQ